MARVFYTPDTTITRNTLSDKIIVLDVDETLVHTVSNDEYPLFETLNLMDDPSLIGLRSRLYKMSLVDAMTPLGSGVVDNFWGVMRPHLKEFLIFCFSYFRMVIIWSAGRKGYVESIVDYIFRDIMPPHIVFTYDDCKKTKDGFIIKPLIDLINKDPRIGNVASLANTFVVDDRDSTFMENKGNGILIPAYIPPITIDGMTIDDSSLIQLMYWLSLPNVKSAKDVRQLDTTKIFKVSVFEYAKMLGI